MSTDHGTDRLDERMDRRLRDAGRQWRESYDAPAAVDIDAAILGAQQVDSGLAGERRDQTSGSVDEANPWRTASTEPVVAGDAAESKAIPGDGDSGGWHRQLRWIAPVAAAAVVALIVGLTQLGGPSTDTPVAAPGGAHTSGSRHTSGHAGSGPAAAASSPATAATGQPAAASSGSAAHPATDSASGASTAPTSKLSPAERQVATTVALKEARSSIPAADGMPRSTTASTSATQRGGITWPPNVSAVASISSTRGQAETYVGAGETSNTTPVVVVQLVGDFVVATSGPSPSNDAGSVDAPESPEANSATDGNWARGQVMTVVADASSGQVLDFGLEPSNDPKISIPNPQFIYQQ